MVPSSGDFDSISLLPQVACAASVGCADSFPEHGFPLHAGLSAASQNLVPSQIPEVNLKFCREILTISWTSCQPLLSIAYLQSLQVLARLKGGQ